MATWWPRVAWFVARLPGRFRDRPLPELLRAITPAGADGRPRLTPPEMARVIWNVLRWNAGPFNNGCFVRSFTRWHFFHRIGCKVEYHLGLEVREVEGSTPGGVASSGEPPTPGAVGTAGTPSVHIPWHEQDWTRIRSHAWLTRDGAPFLEFEPWRFAGYREIFHWNAPPAGTSPGAGSEAGPRSAGHRILEIVLTPGPADLTGRCDAALSGSGFDAAAFERRAVELGLGPLLHYQLRQARRLDRLPASTTAHLASIEMMTAIRNGLLQHHLQRLSQALGEHEIPLIVLKGPDLMRHVYPSPACRVTLDLDLLLPEEKIEEAEAVLRSLGCHAEREELAGWFEEELHHGHPWKTPDRAFTIELHWDLTRPGEPFRFDRATLWRQARPWPELGPTAHRLGPTEQAHYLAVHTFRHLLNPEGAIRSLVDLAWWLDSREGQAWRAAARGPTPPETAANRGAATAACEAIDWIDRWKTGTPSATAAGRTIGSIPLDALVDMPVGRGLAVAGGLTTLAQLPDWGERARWIWSAVTRRPADLARDLKPGEAARPAPARTLALIRAWSRDARSLGWAGFQAAWRAGAYRRRLASLSDGGPRRSGRGGERGPAGEDRPGT